ncbi:MAG: class I SAM-dependent methyltransferase, partial [Nitrospirae bacterium]|nr:class I SAM-dependent methyltransferase [Nitrospirota bacterium]
KYYIKKTNNHIVTCDACGLLQVNPRNHILNFMDFDKADERDEKLKQLFSKMEGSSGQCLEDMMSREALIKAEHFRNKIRKIEQYKKTGRLLDVGCAEGAFLSACSSGSFELYGVEPSEYIFPELKKAVPGANLYNTTLLETKFPSNYFDVIVLINTIEHLWNPAEIIDEAHRILKEDGLLMIEIPDAGHWIARLMGKKWFPVLIPDHLVFFSKATMNSLLKKTGFEVLDITSSHKVVSLRLLLFHAGRVFRIGWSFLKLFKRIGLADKIVSIPQWDEMILYATKRAG